MKILVTGGAGFIGSHLCEALLERGDSVICVDNFNDYYSEKTKKRNLKECRKKNNFKLIKSDIKKKLSKAFSENPEAIVHLAARAGVRPSLEKPFLYYDANVKGTISILQQAVKNKVKNIIFGSTSSVYGKSKKIPFSEEDKCMPISPYSASKISGEYICRAFSEQYGLNIACLRFFTVYGPRNRPDMGVHKFTRKIMRGTPIEMYGDGTTKRDYTYVADIVKGILGAIDNNKGFEVFNLGNNNTVELRRLISTIEACLGKKANIVKKPMQPGDVEITYAKIDKAKEKLGYHPKVKIEEGISNFVNWYKGVLD